MIDHLNTKFIEREIVREISEILNSVGIMFRIFSRSKSSRSVSKKIESDQEYGKSKKIQDLLGIRIVLYFNDDIETVRNIISRSYSESSNDVSIDAVNSEQFKALRYNIIYKLPSNHKEDLKLEDLSNLFDYTFELQIRTIFSEGWHEVEHDLRYKCKSDWKSYELQSRLLNGVYASLETNEWTMIKIFDELSYNHYLNKEWEAMFRQKFRMRFLEDKISSDINTIFQNNSIAKKFFRIERNKLIEEMNLRGFYFPITIDNIIYFGNLVFVKNSEIKRITPNIMINDMT
ncbi:MAG: RelA/SpoT protein [Proteobacteria bacterium]|nr:MAG: RelA/SpoT protein [Pseudomonadota bacterium]